MNMFNLGQDILAHNVIPFLNVKDILSLRLASKYTQTVVESCDWDRRYYEDFPFDARRLEGHGFARYSRRCRARIVLDGILDKDEGYEKCSVFEDHALLETIASEPIVDMVPFECDNYDDSSGDYLSGDGVVVRRLNNSLVAYTAQGLRAVLDTTDVSRLHCFRFLADLSGDHILGWKGGELVEYGLDNLGLSPSLFDDGNEEALGLALKERDSITPRASSAQLSGADLDMFRECDTLPDANVPRRLKDLPLSLCYYFTKIKCEMEAQTEAGGRERYSDLVANLQKEFPVRLDMVVPSSMELLDYQQIWEPYAVAASAGCTIFVLGHAPSADGVYRKYSFTLPHKIVTLIASRCLCALDEKGNVYVGRLSLPEDEEIVVSEPKLMLQNAVQLVGPDVTYDKVRALMSDGTVNHVCIDPVGVDGPEDASGSAGNVSCPLGGSRMLS